MSNPFPELRAFDVADPRPPAPQTIGQAESWLADEMKRAREQEMKRTIVNSPAPDQVARVTRAARETGVPPLMIEGRIDEVERSRRADALNVVGAKYPAIGGALAANPRTAVAAQNDAESLGFIGQAWDTIKKLPATGKAALYGTSVLGAKMNDAVADYLGEFGDFMSVLGAPNTLTVGDLERRKAERRSYWGAGITQSEKKRDKARPQYTGPVQQGLLQGLENVPSSITAIGVGALTRSPNATLAMIGGQTALPAYSDARREGKDMVTATRYGVTQGAVEVLTEKLPASSLLEAIVKRTPFGKNLVRQLGQEIPGEQLATVLQDFDEWATLHPDKAFSDYIAERPSAALQTLLGTVSGTTAQTAAAHVATRGIDASGKIIDGVAQGAQARREAKAIDQFAKAAETSSLRKIDQYAFAELIRASNDTGATDVYIPGEVALAYLQSDSFDPDRDAFSEYSEDIYAAAASGGDFVMPIGEAIAKLPGTPAWLALKDEMRLTPGGVSKREADTFDEAIEEVMGDLTQRMEAVETGQAKERGAREKLADSIALKLGESYTAPAARTMAEVTAQYMQTRAARLGVELQGGELDSLDIKQVLPEALAAARQADATDLVINALRKGGKSSKQGGKSLIEWIAARGGINDNGGDLASMGLGEWHKAKKFRKKAIRPFDPQAALGGISGDGDYGLDSTLRAAIDEGYFPELQGGEIADEAAAMLEAINAELSGSPRYAQDLRVDNMRAAAEELRQLLTERGLDPNAMSDAEVRKAIDALSEQTSEGGLEQGSDPVAILTGEEIAPLGASVKELRAAAREWYDTTLKGTTVSSQALGGREVSFRSSRKAFSTSADPRKLRAFAGVHDLIANAELIETTEPADITVEPTTKAYHYLEGLIEIGGKREVVGVTVREDANGDIYYNHSMREIAASVPLDTASKAGPGNEGGALEQVVQNGDDFNLVVKSLKQRADTGPHGRIRFDEGRTLIELFQTRNLSTYFHEFGHFALENLRIDASLPDAPGSLKADWQTVEKWFAANGHPVAGGIPVEGHELWARGFERYLMEGKAPSAGLKRIFETVRSWMMSIYKTIDALRSPITPEIREVMDRLLATEEEIAEARERQGLEALFKDAASVGMSQQEFAAYGRQVDDARIEAHTALVDKTLAAVRRRETKRYRDARKDVRAEIEAEVDARPMFRAIHAMKVTPISEEWVRDEMGEDALSLLPKRIPPIYRAGGANPSNVAEMAGYATGKQMVEALIGAEIAHRQEREGGDKRSLRERTIETATDVEMERRYGDPLGDGTIEREALAAVHSDMQGEVIASEIRVLARRTGNRPTPYSLAKDWARNRVRAGRYADQASPAAIQRHARNAARAGRAAEQAFLKQDADEAFRQKQFQMLNNALLSEAKAAHDEVEAAVKRMGKIASRRTMDTVDQAYLEQAQGLLEQVDLKERTQRSLDRKEAFADWAAARQAEGFDVVVPPSFAETLAQTNWSRLPVEQLLTLDETIKQIIHLGRLKQTLLDNRERRDFDEVISEGVASADLNGNNIPPSDLLEPAFWERAKSRVAAIDSALLKMETVFDWLDGGKSNGVFNRVVFRPIADAQHNEQTRLADVIGKLNAAMKNIPAKTLKRWSDKVSAPELLNRETGRPFVMTRDQLISVALNFGNQGNIDKLTGGYGWNEGAVREALARELTAEEWAYVQEVWDTIDSLWSDIEALEKRLNGVAPEKVEAVALETPFGTIRGGYFPVVYDPRRNYQAEANAAKNSGLFENIYTRATTSKGFTKERTKVERPIHLSLSIINRHVGEVVHDLTHREAIMQADKFLSDRRIMQAVDDALGPEVRRQFRPWLQRIANEWAYDRAGLGGLEGFIRTARLNTTIVGMGFRVSTMMMQGAGFSNSIEVVGARWMTPAIARAAANPIEAGKFVNERSGEVRARMDNLDRDIRDNVKRVSGARNLSAIKRFAFHGIGYMDRIVVVPTWLGAYDKAIAGGMDEQDAIYAADKAVRQSQGSGAAKDLAAVQAGRGAAGEAMKLLTMFYSYMSAFYQRERHLGRDIRRGGTKDIPRLLARAWWLIIVPPLLSELLAGRGPDEDDEEGWASWSFERITLSLFGPIPIARDVLPVIAAKWKDKGTFGYRFTPVSGSYESLIRLAEEGERIAEGDDTKALTRTTIETVGYFTGLTTGQMAAAAQFLVDVGSGDADPEGFADWWEGLTKGKI